MFEVCAVSQVLNIYAIWEGKVFVNACIAVVLTVCSSKECINHMFVMFR